MSSEKNKAIVWIGAVRPKPAKTRKKLSMVDGQSDQRTDGPTDGWTDGRTNKAERGVT